MPKKQEKSREEKTAEDYFNVDKSDLNFTIEKPVKEFQEIEKVKIEKPSKETKISTKTTIEKTYSKPAKNEIEKVEYKKRTYKKKNTKKTNYKTPKTFSPQKISLKKSGYELIITEKPQAAMKIASALGNVKKLNDKGVPYYEVSREGKKIYVGCAVGHLFTLSQDSTGSQVPTFEISWKPNFYVRKKDFTKKYYDVLAKLAKNAGSLTVASDYDVEGEVIGLNVVRFICNQENASRMKFSTLTDKELNNAYEEKSPSINWGQALAGETRHYLDWFYGINLSRALMNAIKTTGSFKIMSIGRVQGPALNLIVKKEKEIQEFKSKKYWQAFITISDKKNSLELKYIKDIFDKKELEKFSDLKNQTAIAETKKSEQIIPPQSPFNLTTLQTEAYKFFGITPSKTLQLAQSLYLNGLISYPRTSSQKLPDSIAYQEILKKLSKQYHVEHLIKRQKPIEGKKTDPAHPSIYPTAQENSSSPESSLSSDEKKIYSLIVKRFLSLFCEDAIIANKVVKATVTDNKKNLDFQQSKGQGTGKENLASEIKGKVENLKNENLIFSTRGMAIVKKAWLEIYPSKQKENEIPDFNGKVEIINSRTEEKETQPPKRYSPASIITQLEKKNLGTKATRASILETLYDRGYVQDQSIKATPLGISLIETLEKYSPIIIDEKLTRHFEKQIENFVDEEKNLEKEKLEKQEEKIIDEAKKTITKIAKQFQENENKIGKELLQATQDLREQQKIQNTIMQCPKCKKGNLAITYSKKTKRYFVACDAYPNCKTTFSLPPNGIIKTTDKICEQCNWPMLIRLAKGKRPWIFCFNPECPSRQQQEERKIEKEEI